LPQEVRTITRMLERHLNTPMTSSAGRLFDAVAALAGLRDRVSYEGQAAIELEWLANAVPADGSYPFDLLTETATIPLVVDTRPLVQAIARDVSTAQKAGRIARRFHTTLVDIIVAVCQRLRAAAGPSVVVLSGGVFLNALLTREACAALGAAGFRVYRHRLVPPSDGGLSLGQLAIAARHRASAPQKGNDHVPGDSR
jgi:hydrogenase maturation protein HypF